jgi:uncharacterized OB-fold protein
MDLIGALDAPLFGERRRWDASTGRLLGTRCGECGSVSWPGRPVCQRCGAAAAKEVQLSDEGILITYTTVWVPRPGLTTPYVLGQVDLPEGVRIFAHGRGLTEDHRVPLRVRLVLAEQPDTVPPFFFQPEEDS